MMSRMRNDVLSPYIPEKHLHNMIPPRRHWLSAVLDAVGGMSIAPKRAEGFYV
jgi:hypothetical protein